jgi:hypothetical protein
MHVDPKTQLASSSALTTTSRRFAQISLGAATGLATLLGGETPPAVRAQTHEISLLSPDHFLPGSDKKLGERAQRFTADGKTVAVTSTATEVATEHVKRPDTDAVEPDVLLWDDNSNNRLLLSGKGSWIHHAHSHYLMAKEKTPGAEQIYAHLSPQGPGGRHTPTVVRSLGIRKLSKNIDAAKEWRILTSAPRIWTCYLAKFGEHNSFRHVGRDSAKTSSLALSRQNAHF